MFYFFYYKICYLSYITSQTFLRHLYQCLFLLFDRTLIYHEISYMDPYLDSMKCEVEGRSPLFIQHRTNRSYEMKNEYLLNCEELLEDQRFVFFTPFMTNKLENDYFKL